MKTLPKLLLLSLFVSPLLPAQLNAAEPAAEKSKAEDGGKKKKKKNKDKNKNKGQKDEPAAAVTGGSAKDAPPEIAEPAASNNGDWCTWLQNDPGLLYDNDKNPWIQSFEIGGRFHYQAAYVEGTDINGLDFNDKYDEYRRLRLETKTEFLRFLTAEINVNLVSDNRFRDDFFSDLEWGYDRFDEASLELDVDKMLGTGGPFDNIKVKYGRMKLKMTEEVHMSSNEIYTIERSHIADKLGGNQSRPTGATLELDKGPWELVLGIYSAEDDADFIGGWNDGHFYYGSLAWQATDEFKLQLDYSQNELDDRALVDDALGYSWATALSAIYEKKDWGVIAEAIYGDNGGANGLIPRRAGDFHAFVVMPWYWIIEDKLQVVVQYQYASSPESQGLQIPSRYIRADHENPAVDVDNGRGNEHHYLYAGLNYHLCRDRVKLMGGVALDDLTTRRSEVKGLTYQVAFRTAF
ncbi:OprO/OprP family phosphate-selective porin [Luteolibacter sp. GHJ8]|uniref:OprO/OprP family phosphate-selective porin n=1 Tax=Luteolibacter rhizosphaerae TaxID=2989719 RepID=A0ABT3FYW8_9BACT|nr:OprO/OprP family phosphate-selective porin [Luteolibacter rhizosphaerae]MCW1912617.1 OprO/OprP family phosphate-selective porin [Luteolibacter rhizosphaerae]